ncbi:ice-binding family protein [Aequorivita antarctica]|uniref:DUF3494 domain-containing protein n=1 Tax=Aequorivita antarctica TaxID=153266 RepID=A0A5C6YWV4_9FLAO|nr:ice-binding family protein [Aequorivita antarctica]TXD72124.1 DUF3494 domain-containing protein [Aequorivita antarctica]SRX75194.1 hypothetical protein AEQU3_02188 [Aequorivita antarctica]
MKIILSCFILLISSSLYPQVGIGTSVPDSSAALDVFSNSKGLLMPRLSTVERDAILLPANGLMIYNHTLNDGQLNIGTPLAPVWIGIKSQEGPMIDSVTESAVATIASPTKILVPGMTMSPALGTYLVLFNAQMSNETVSPAQGVIDLNKIYNDLMAIPATNTTHGPVFGNGEVLTPGIYDLAAATSVAGTLTLDGGSDSNSVFIIRTGGAFSTGASSTVVLTNGASSNNIFWVAEGAISMGATTTMKGTLLAHTGAVTMGADSNLEGRMFSTTGAISMGTGTLNAPSGVSYIDLGVLSTFVKFSTNGAISNSGVSTINGDVGNAEGAITGFGGINGNVYGSGGTYNSEATYGIYKNGVEVVNSSRTINVHLSIVSLQAVVTVIAGDEIDIRCKVDTGEAVLNHRTLSLIRSGY